MMMMITSRPARMTSDECVATVGDHVLQHRYDDYDDYDIIIPNIQV